MAGRANTQFSVAAHALVYLAGAGGGFGAHARPVSSDELAQSVNVNPVHLRRVLGPLREAGLLRSRPGARGGWELARAAEHIRLDEVWEVVVTGALVATHGPNPSCPIGRQVHGLLGDIEDDMAQAVRAALHRRTVAELVRRVSDEIPADRG
ncbi:transcriptional regulator, BadM/Rrf2 family [Jatrophihabitans endophyticus]|uniref:Transcriptional regulator, BadM/Rrf2 family n=1 Tax=Jatrophihabitans endophyticus TaxID=1206085 RepID=A0A1M5TWF2_9ACTN|nr:Rrf2 family transcriptional regulator [Jatrophihabitans endophyticus]SHH54713.1 transcriptional regulator, BadM/Rrf2 family [Jatrophihabitans endophyticus]